MKKLLILLSGLLTLVLAGCNKDEATPPASFDRKDLISGIFSAGMAWNTEVKSLKSTCPINIQVDNYHYGTEGGFIHVLGSVTGSMSIDDVSGSVLGGAMLIGLTETISAYTFVSDGKTYTANGAPHISLAGTITLLPGGTTFGMASSMEILGGIRVTGPGLDEPVNMQLTIVLNTLGSGGRVCGMCGGEAINYIF